MLRAADAAIRMLRERPRGGGRLHRHDKGTTPNGPAAREYAAAGREARAHRHGFASYEAAPAEYKAATTPGGRARAACARPPALPPTLPSTSPSSRS
jgi:hypothetical protein